ncbi:MULTISPECIES: type VI secretion system ATPase TssH [unclassified Serratia (in: enterobacteria)]|uniref:type VI secretion system ATPase TssH n=1 Tax=unclassified Serratia (in: enterobacteria) TaxID=2647522 RepID=UPI00050272F5|nr:MULTISPECIES: type VI secretion system ATPase TssH [unclassified Serratia (in: enterobacteria)]KFK91926.1 ATPase [Serratia sp. Ag2]KFK95197.1 ATPase [Serratia sp. Ag1]
MSHHAARLLHRLNPYCAQALAAAATLCQTRGHGEITVEHWLLKLLEQGDGDISMIARRYDWDQDALWHGLLAHLEPLPHQNQGKPQLSAPLEHLIQSAWLEASAQVNTEAVRSLHVLMALVASPFLITQNATWPLLSLNAAQLAHLLPLLDAQSAERPGKPPRLEWPIDVPVQTTLSPTVEPDQALQAELDNYTQDLTAKARAGQIDPVLGRDNEIRQMVDILSRRRKNNPILVGEPGVGKTALVEGLALRLAEGDVPASLKDIAIRTLDLGLLQAGAGVRGEFEQRLKNVIAAVQQSPTPILLFIDEAHTLIGAGNQAGGADAANLLKPALARGELRTIAATTWAEYKQYFERDAALERRFQRVLVEEPDDANACLMLRGLKARYATYHGVHICDSAVKAAVTLSRRYLTGRQLPDKAVDLLDTASARVRMGLDSEPEQIVHLRTELAALTIEQQMLEQDKVLDPAIDPARLADISDRLRALQKHDVRLAVQYEAERALTEQLLTARQDGHSRREECDALRVQLQDIQRCNPLLWLDVDARAVATVIADWTGVPLGSLLKDEQSELLQLERRLEKRVVGQEAALSDLAQRLRATRAGLTPDNGPQGVFLLVGPSGVGKTETALALADTLFGGEASLITVNLSEYQEAHTVSQLKGSPPGYVGYGQGGMLTEAVRQRPYSVVLLDEVEKAHRDVINLFYQVFDRGFMRDGEGREIDFRNTVIVMTSNLGSDALMAYLNRHPEAPDSELHEQLYPLLRDHFQPALLARFQTLIYRPLGAKALKRIVSIKLTQLVQRLQQHYGLRCVMEDSLSDALVAACLQPDSGARHIDSLLNQHILPVLSQQLLNQKAAKHNPTRLTLGWSKDAGILLEFDGEKR